MCHAGVMWRCAGRRGTRSEIAPFGTRRPKSEVWRQSYDDDGLPPGPFDDDDDDDDDYDTFNKQYVVAYSDRTFNGRGHRDTSALRGHPY